MPQAAWNIEYSDANSQRSYPLAEHATKTDISGSFSLPDSFLLGLHFPTHSGLDVVAENFFIGSVTVFPTGYTVTLSYDDGQGGSVTVATVSIAKATHVPGRSYGLHGVGDFADSLGSITIGRTEDVDETGAGKYLFDLGGGGLGFDTIRPVLKGVSSLRVANGSDISDPITGDIEIVAGTNIRLTPIQVPGRDPKIRIDAIEGEGLNESCVCEDGNDLPPIRTINGIGPTPSGNFTIVGDDCLSVIPATNGLQLEDVCSQPCCGCEELEVITSDLEQFGTGARTLQALVSRLQQQVESMSLHTLTSRLGDQGCVEC